MRELVAACVVWWLTVGFLGPVHAARRALLVGINKYADSRITKLKGCENDVRALASTLKAKHGFTDSDIHALYSGQATEANIKRELQSWLIGQSKPGDTIIFLFSGHGSQCKDQSGDEPDGRDEIICCADYNVKTQSGKITDDEFGVMVRRLSGRNITLLFDSCHSGSMTKNLNAKTVVIVDRIDVDTIQGKWIPPPPEVETISQTKALTKAGGVIDDPDLDHVLFSACMASETAADAAFFEGGRRKRHGAFTYMFLKGLTGAGDRDGDGKVSNKEIVQYVTDKLRQSEYSFTQTPELSTRSAYVNRPVFVGVQPPGGPPPPVPRMDGWRVVRRDKTTATINRGSAHGVTRGATFDVYVRPPGGSRRTVGSFRATRVESSLATGPLRLPTPVPQGDVLWVRQRSFEPPSGTDQLRVCFLPMRGSDAGRHPPEDLLEIVQESPRYVRVGDAQQADRIVRWRAIDDDGDGDVEMVVANRYGRVVSRFKGNDHDASRLLRKVLRREWVLKKLSALENPRPQFRATVRVAGDNRDFRMGDEIRFELSVSRDCYVTLLAVDSEGNITKLFPNQWQRANRIRGGRWYFFPPDEAGFRFYAKPPAGRDVLIAIATAKPVELTVGDGDDPVRVVKQVNDGLKSIGVAKARDRLGGDAGDAAGALPTDGWSSASLTIETFDSGP